MRNLILFSFVCLIFSVDSFAGVPGMFATRRQAEYVVAHPPKFSELVGNGQFYFKAIEANGSGSLKALGSSFTFERKSKYYVDIIIKVTQVLSSKVTHPS